MERVKRLCIKYLNSDIIIATAGCLEGLNSSNNNSSWFRCSCGEPAPGNNQLVRTETSLARLGKTAVAKARLGHGQEEGQPRPAGEHSRTPGAAGCRAFVRGGGGGIWTRRSWKKSAARRQDTYCLRNVKVKDVKQATSPALRLREVPAFPALFLALPPTIYFLDQIELEALVFLSHFSTTTIILDMSGLNGLRISFRILFYMRRWEYWISLLVWLSFT